MRRYTGTNPNTEIRIMDWKEVTVGELEDLMNTRNIAVKSFSMDSTGKTVRLVTVYRKPQVKLLKEKNEKKGKE